MKFTAEKSIILKALGHVQSVVEKRSTVPVLANVKIDADGGKIRLTATDMEISISEAVTATVDEDGFYHYTGADAL